MELPKFPVEIQKGNTRVKIYRRDDDRFRVMFYSEGKRREETFADFQSARERAGKVAQSVGDPDLELKLLPRDEYALCRRSMDIAASVGMDILTVAREYVEARRVVGDRGLNDALKWFQKHDPSTLKKISVPDLVREFLEEKRADGATEVYVRNLGFMLGRFAEAMQINSCDLTADIIDEFLRGLNLAGRSRNNYRRAIGTLLKFAERKRAIPKEWIKISEIARVREESFEIEIFTPEEMRKLLAAAAIPNKPGVNRRYRQAQGILPLLVLGGFAGMRTAEVTRQRWSDVHVDRGFIRVTGVKGNTPARRLIPIHDNLKAWLEKCGKTSDFCCSYPRPAAALSRLAKRAGVEWRNNGLRHSFVSYRVAEAQDIAKVALEAGNSVTMIYRHYREIVTPEQAKEWFSILPG